MDEEGNEIEGTENTCLHGDKNRDGFCYKKDGICTWDKVLLEWSTKFEPIIVREPTRQISVSVYWFVMPILIVNHSGILVNKVTLLFRRFNWSYIFVFSGQVKFVLYYYPELNFSSTA